MPNPPNKSSQMVPPTTHSNTSLVTNPRLLATSNSVNGLMAYTSRSLLYPAHTTDKKNHRLLSMIFFALGILVIFRLTHG